MTHCPSDAHLSQSMVAASACILGTSWESLRLQILFIDMAHQDPSRSPDLANPETKLCLAMSRRCNWQHCALAADNKCWQWHMPLQKPWQTLPEQQSHRFNPCCAIRAGQGIAELSAFRQLGAPSSRLTPSLHCSLHQAETCGEGAALEHIECFSKKLQT